MDEKTNKKDVRVSIPDRRQWEWKDFCLDEFLPQDHLARIVWAYVQGLDLTPLYDKIKTSSHGVGRNAIAPEILLSLWIYATLESIGSAREIGRRTTRDLPFMWICGGVSVNYHAISDFRKDHAEFLESLLVDSISSLIDQGLVSLKRIAQDGVRVKASAGRSSFRRKSTLEQLRDEVQAHVDQLEASTASESTRQELDARKEAAQKRAARERAERIEEALAQREELAKARDKRKKGEGESTRCSTTDPDARNMKMPNGGYDPAYNVQLGTEGKNNFIVAVKITNEGIDGSQLPPMLDQLQRDYGERPVEALVDSAYATQASITKAEQKGTRVFGGIPRASQLLGNGKDPFSPQPRDSEEYEGFRKRMSEPTGQEIFKQRSQLAEFPHANFRNNGLRQFLVRGSTKVKSVVLLHALTYNFRRMLTLGLLGPKQYVR